jgi:repressor LexA
MSRPITPRQQQAMEYIEAFHGVHGRTPTYSELNTKFAWTSDNTARGILEALERKGYIRRAPGRHRNITIIRSAYDD